MNTATQTITQVVGGQERLMIPAGTQPSTSKRKTTGEDDSQHNAVKKPRQEITAKQATTTKRKLIGEEQPGGLVIVRASSLRPPPSQGPSTSELPARSTSRQLSVPPPRTITNGGLSIPPAKKLRADADVEPVVGGKGKEREREMLVHGGTEPEVAADVRIMQSEADNLRKQSRAAESLKAPATDFHFPAPFTNGKSTAPSSRPSQPRGRTITRETSLPIPEQETPRIQRNKMMRAEPGHTRRKSSLTRGKRIATSYANTGVITQPHTSVRDSSFYKHIDVEQPEPQRAKQLLIWCSYRAMNELTEEQTRMSAASKQTTSNPGKDPPPLSTEDVDLLKSVEEDIIKMLAESKIDTNVFSPPEEAEAHSQLKPNEQNIRNRAREVRFNAHIQKLKQEDEAWIEVGTSYNSFRASVLAELEERKKDFPSAKAKGKQKATAEDVALWDISEKDLPEYFRGKDGLGLARALVEARVGQRSPLQDRMDDLQYAVDRLHSLAHSALEATRLAETDLDRRFAALNLSMQSRVTPLPSTSSTSVLSAFLPPNASRPPQTASPQDLLRAMSRLDASRPQTQVGDAARRAAREVQRAHDAPERRLTGVPPPTPRKPPGTPRRPTTPARGR